MGAFVGMNPKLRPLDQVLRGLDPDQARRRQTPAEMLAVMDRIGGAIEARQRRTAFAPQGMAKPNRS